RCSNIHLADGRTRSTPHRFVPLRLRAQAGSRKRHYKPDKTTHRVTLNYNRPAGKPELVAFKTRYEIARLRTMSSRLNLKLTPEEYLAFERRSDERNEYVND